MKKKIAMLLVVVMMVLMGTTAFAAESPTTDTSDTTDSDATDYDNVLMSGDSVVVNGIVVSEVPEVKPVKKSKVDEAQKEAEKLVAPTSKVIQIVDVNIKADGFIQQVVTDVGIDLRDEDYDTLTMTFDVDGVVLGQKLVLLVQKTDGTWVTVTPDKVENGKVTATFTFSVKTVAFVAYNASAQTGEVASVLPGVMCACAAAIVVCGKKAKRSK